MKRYIIRISGKVQGVFFRAHTKQKADELGIKGFVKNERDGSVYIEVEASNQVIQEFIAWCRRGPERAAVIKVEVSEMPLNNFTVFEIRR